MFGARKIQNELGIFFQKYSDKIYNVCFICVMSLLFHEQSKRNTKHIYNIMPKYLFKIIYITVLFDFGFYQSFDI